MRHTSITVSREAQARLKKLKGPGDSYSDVILRETPDPCMTAGELLERLERSELPKAEPELRAAMLSGRGRRSKRRGLRVK